MDLLEVDKVMIYYFNTNALETSHYSPADLTVGAQSSQKGVEPLGFILSYIIFISI